MLSGDPATAVRAVSPLARSPLRGHVATVRVTPDEVALVLRSGLQLELGNTHNLSLKLMVGAQIAHSARHATGYIDLTVPDRPVSNLNPQS